MNQKCTPLCMLLNINSRRVYAIFSKCFLLRFFDKETFQSKYVSTFDTFVKIVPTTFKKLLSLFLKFAKHLRISKCKRRKLIWGTSFGFTLDLQKETASLFPLGSLINLVFFQNTEIFAGNILKPFDTVLNLVSTSSTEQ